MALWEVFKDRFLETSGKVMGSRNHWGLFQRVSVSIWEHRVILLYTLLAYMH